MTRSGVYRSIFWSTARRGFLHSPAVSARPIAQHARFSTTASAALDQPDIDSRLGLSASSLPSSSSSSRSKPTYTRSAPDPAASSSSAVPADPGRIGTTASLQSTPPESRAPWAPLPYTPSTTYGLPFPLARPVSVPSAYPGQLPVHYTNWPYRVLDGTSPLRSGRVSGTVPPGEADQGGITDEEMLGMWLSSGADDAKRARVVARTMGMTDDEMRGLRKHVLATRLPSHMTNKGRTARHQVWTLVGDPARGMVGLGRGDSTDFGTASLNANLRAVLNMDYVDRYEGRTIWGQGKEVRGKWVSTNVLMRARPAGFGLMVPHSVHRVLTCAGIRDCSAAIHGSSDPVAVAKCVLQMLHGGANPPGFGGGILGRKGRREDKGWGSRSRDQIERERGRWGVDVGRKV